MSSNSLIWPCAMIGVCFGSLLPALWGADIFSFSAIILGTLCGILGVLVGYKISHY